MKNFTRSLIATSVVVMVAFNAYSQVVYKTANVGIGNVSPLSRLEVNGSFGEVVTAVSSANVPINLDATYGIVIATPNAVYSINLPVATTATRRIYTVVYNGAAGGNTITIAANGSDKIIADGVSGSSYALTSGSVTIQSAGLVGGVGTWYVSAKAVAASSSLGTVTLVSANAPLSVTTPSTTPALSLIGTAGTILYGTGAASAFSGVGTAGYLLQSNGASAPTWVSPTGTPATAWTLTGNTVTTSNFLGTTTAASIIFEVNSAPAGRIDWDNGNTGPGNVYFGSYGVLGTTTYGSPGGSTGDAGAFNVGIGLSALGGATGVGAANGEQNIAIGAFAYALATGGIYNIAIGPYSQFNGTFATTAVGNNTAIGPYSMYSNTTGQSNTALGYQSMYGNSTGTPVVFGSFNTAQGYQSLYNIGNGGTASGGSNTAIGSNAAFNTYGGRNTAVGDSTLYTNTTGEYNTGVGYQANVGAASLSNATAIGYQSIAPASNSLTLGNTAVTYVSGSSGLYLPGYNVIGGVLYTAATTGQVAETPQGSSGYVLELNGSNVPTWINPAVANAWNLTGNSNTVPGTNFVGTTNNVGLEFKINGVYAGSLDNAVNTVGVLGTWTNVNLGYESSGGVSSGGVGDWTGGGISIGAYANGNAPNGPSTSWSPGIVNGVTIGAYAQYNAQNSEGVAIGYQTQYYNGADAGSGAYNTVGTQNTSVGAFSLYNNTIGNDETALGSYSMYGEISGAGSVTSSAAVKAAAIGYDNTAIGYQSLYNVSGSGLGTLAADYVGGANTAIGSNALVNTTTGEKNTGVGDSTLYSNTTGSENTALGYQANVTGNPTNATVIGYQATQSASNSVTLGNTSASLYLPSLATPGAILYTAAGGAGLVAETAAGSAGYILQSNGAGAPTWVSPGSTVAGAWYLTGNAGIVPGTNFIGTTTAAGFVMKVNGIYAGSIDYVGSGYGSESNVNLGYGSAGNTANGDLNAGSVAIGAYANASAPGGYAAPFISNSVSVGAYAQFKATNSSSNVAVGYATQYYNGSTATSGNAATVGTDNVSVGAYSLYNNTLGYQETALGYYSMYGSVAGAGGASATVGINNTAVGYSSLYNISGNSGAGLSYVGGDNTAVGSNALYSTTTGEKNTAVGDSALVSNTTGEYNTALGYFANVISPNLSYATAIGAYASAPASNSVTLGVAANAISPGSAATTLYLPGYTTIGSILYTAAASGQVAETPAGTAGYVLELTGSPAVPTWVNPGLNAWLVTGNSGTTPGTNFVGTTDAIAGINGGGAGLRFEVDGKPAGSIDYTAASSVGNGANAYFGYGTGNLTAGDYGSDNAAVGTYAMGNIPSNTNTLGYSGGSVAIGYYTMYNSQINNANVAVGAYSQYYANNINNISVGSYSLYNNTGNGTPAAIGTGATASTGINETALGYYSMYGSVAGVTGGSTASTMGNSNTAVGYQSLMNIGAGTTGGGGNTAVGSNAGIQTTGGRNTAVGDSALSGNTTGEYNTAIGYNANVSSGSLSYATAIGANSVAPASNSVTLGVASPTATLLYLPGYGAAGTILYTATTTGQVASSAVGTAGYILASGGTGAPTWVAPVTNAWNTTGNSGIVYNTYYLGTQSGGGSQLEFKVNGAYAGVLDATNANVYLGAGSGNDAGSSTIASGSSVGIGWGALSTINSNGAYEVAIGYNALAAFAPGAFNNAANTAVGAYALANATTGTPDEAFGYKSNYSITTGSYNTALGYDANYWNSTGTANVALGDSSMWGGSANWGPAISAAYTGATANTAVGVSALSALSTGGSYNTAVGYEADIHNTTGIGNTGAGYQANYSNQKGYGNAAVGYQALYSNTYSGNTAVGAGALRNNNIGGSANGPNTAIGDSAMYANVIGVQNVAVGWAALTTATPISGVGGNTAVGYASAKTLTNGTNNTALGANTSPGTTQSGNTVIGEGANATGTTGNNTALGYLASATGNSNATAIGANASATIANTVILGSGASVGIGTQTPQRELEIGGTSNTIRVDGISSTGTFNAAPSANTDQIMYAKSTGDIYSIPNGASGSVLGLVSGVPTWTPSAASLTATAPLYITSSNITLQGTYGGVFYGTGSGAAATTYGPTGDVLIGQGAGLPPTWSTLAAIGGVGDNWGTQVAITDSSNDAGSPENTISGNGFGAPLRIAKDGATTGQVLAWNGTTWKPASGNASLTTYSITNTGASSSVVVGGGFANSVVGTSNVTLDVQGVGSNNGGVFYSTGFGSSAAFSSTGTAGYLLQSNGATAPSWVSPASVANAWYLTGNSGVVYGTNYIGTTNASAGQLEFKAGNLYMGELDPNSSTANVYFGRGSGGDSTALNTADANVGIGYETLHSATTGTSGHVAIGYDALRNFSQNEGAPGTNSIITTQITPQGTNGVGAFSLYNLTTPIGPNDAFGFNSGFNLTTGYLNISIGFNSNYWNQTGAFDVAVGDSAMYGGTGAVYTNANYNTAVGVSALAKVNSNAAYNTATGYEALLYNTTGNDNVGIGYRAGYANQTSSNNTAVGYQSLYSNTSHGNTAVGANSLFNNTTGSNNVAIGDSSLYNNTAGYKNVAVGTFDLAAAGTGGGATSDTANTAIGDFALEGLTTGYNNVALGTFAANVSNPSFSVLAGFDVMRGTPSGTSTVADIGIGASALYSATGSYDIAIGGAGGSSSTIQGPLNFVSGNYDIGIGYEAGNAGTAITTYNTLTSGSNDIAIGYQANVGSTGSNNTVVGSSARASANKTNVGAGSNNTVLGYSAAATGTTNSTAIGAYAMADTANTVIIGSISGINGATANAFVGIGTQTPQRILEVGGVANTVRVDGIGSGGSFNLAPSATTDQIMFAKSTGDVYSMPNGTTGNVLAISGSGVPTWTTSTATLTATAPISITAGNSLILSGTYGGVFYGTGVGVGSGYTGYGPPGDVLIGQGAGLPPTWSTLAAIGGVGDNWGTQVAITDSSIDAGSPENTITGNGFGSPLKLAKDGASTGQVLVWTPGSGYGTWKPGSANSSLTSSSIVPASGTSSVVVGNGGSQVVGSSNVTLDVQGNATNAGGLFYSTGLGSSATFTPSGATGQVLQSNGTAAPTWVAPTATNAWLLAGNTITTPYGSQYLGLNTSGFPLEFKVNNAYAGMIDAVSGNFYMGRGTGGDSLTYLTNTGANVALGWEAFVSPLAATTQVTAIGVGALHFDQGSNNTAVGAYSLHNLTTGTPNEGFGYGAGFSLTTGAYNLQMGFDAGYFNQTGTVNVAVGDSAMYGGNGIYTLAAGNTAIGVSSLANISTLSGATGDYNTAVGYEAALHNTTGGFNTALGYQAGYGNKTGYGNVAAGYQALYFNTYSGNTAVGAVALRNNNIGGSANGPNTAVGDSAMYANIIGVQNVAVGWAALTTATPTSGTGGNTAVGYGSLAKLISGTNNTALGANTTPATVTVTTGSNNTSIGANARISAVKTGVGAGTNNTALGYLATTTGTNNSTAIGAYAMADTSNTVILGAIPNVNTYGANPQVNVGIGTQTPQQVLEIGGNSNTIRVDGIASGNTFSAAPVVTTDQIMFAKSTGDVWSMPNTTPGYILAINSAGVPAWTSSGATLAATAPLYVSSGNIYIAGTNDGVLYGTGTGVAFTPQAPATNDVLAANASGVPTWTTLSALAGSGDNWGTQYVMTNASLSGEGLSSNLLGIAQQGATNGEVLAWNSGSSSWVPSTGNASLTTASIVSPGVISVTNGASQVVNSALGNVSLDVRGTAGGVLYGTGTGTSALFTSAGASGTVLTSTGAGAPTWQTVSGATGWSLNGNSIASGNFLGTTNNLPLQFEVDGLQAGTIDASPGGNSQNGNLYMGVGAGNNDAGNYNVGVGLYALESAVNNGTYDGGNIAVGAYALSSMQYGGENIAFGYYSQRYGNFAQTIPASGGNTSIGGYSLYSNSSGQENTALGYYSMYGPGTPTVTGIKNVAVGYQSLFKITGGGSNTTLGSNSMLNTTAGRNTAVGDSALVSNTTGEYNSALGYDADVNAGGLSNATAIGAFAQAGASNSIVLGAISGVNGYSGTFGAGTGVSVCIGTNAPATDAALAIKTGHLETQVATTGNNSGATVVAAGGDASAASLTGTDVAGNISITTTSTGLPGGGTIVTVTYANAYQTAPVVILTPANSTTGSEMATYQPYVGTSLTTGFTISFTGTPSAVQTLLFNYFVIEAQ